MKPSTRLFAALLMAMLISNLAATQEPAEAIVPRLVSYSGRATDGHGSPIAGTTGITFAIYKEQAGGAPLWLETQSVTADAKGNYTVQLGSNKREGLPVEIFNSKESRWLGVQVSGQEEQQRLLLLSVPYALKAADAETIGGLPPSAFLRAAPVTGTAASSLSNAGTTNISATLVQPPSISGSGTLDYLPLWTGSNSLGNSILFQSGTGSSARLGINTTTPTATLDVRGPTTMHGPLNFPAINTANSSSGSNSQAETMVASAFNSNTQTGINQKFRWQAEPVANNTSHATGTLNLLFGQGSASPTETGLKISNTGQITFAAGQTFPGTGPGTITTVTAGNGLTGGGNSGAVTLTIDATKIPQLNVANTFTDSQTVAGNLTASGAVSGKTFQIGTDLFAFGSNGYRNVFLGFAGGSQFTNVPNTAVGWGALRADTTGSSNAAFGTTALLQNTTGSANVAVGDSALNSNTTGFENSGVGGSALVFNTTGHENTAVGFFALRTNTVASFNTALGNYALQNNTANYNTAAGYTAMQSNSTGIENAAFGHWALQANTTGTNNTAIGAWAMHDSVDTTYITAVGYDAGVGRPHGALNTYVGANAYPMADGLFYAGAIGANAHVAESNALILGGTDNAAVTVGIGTTFPYNDYALDVETIHTNGPINGGVVVNASGGNLYLGMTNTVHRFRVDTNGAVYADGGLFASGADFAESVAVNGSPSEYEPGDVLEIDRTSNRHLALAHQPYATLVAGIYSTKPGVTASPHHIDDSDAKAPEVPLAVVGIVPCKVTTENGAIARGDLLVTSSRAGYAMKGTDRRRMLGAVVGKALEPLAKGSGTIEVLVTLQ